MFPAIICSVFFFLLIFKWRLFRLNGIRAAWLAAAFTLKLVAGVVLWYTYTYHYNSKDESDAHRYYTDALIIKQQWTENREVFWSLMLNRDNDSEEFQAVYNKLVGWYSGYRYGLTNDCRTIIRIHVVLAFVSFGSYHVHWICMAFLAFIGLALLYKAFHAFMPEHRWLLFVACFCLPSVVFWSAGLLKEGPTLFALGVLFSGISLLMQNHLNWKGYVLFLLGIIILICVKEYVLFSMLPAITFLLLVKLSGRKWLILKFLVSQAVCFVIAQHAHHFFIGGDFLYVLNKKRVDFENTSLIRQAKSTVYVPATNSLEEFVIHYPQAFALTYLRPWLWECKSWMYTLFAAENVCYLLLLFAAIVFFRMPPAGQQVILLASLSYVLVLASVVGNTVPVLGSVVRYRIAALPMLIIVCGACIRWDKLLRWFNSSVNGAPFSDELTASRAK